MAEEVSTNTRWQGLCQFLDALLGHIATCSIRCEKQVGQINSRYSETKFFLKVTFFSRTRYRALGLELILVYRQSARRWHEVNHAIDLAVGCHYFLQACGYLRSFHQTALSVNGSTHLIPAYYSFIDLERMKGWVSETTSGKTEIFWRSKEKVCKRKQILWTWSVNTGSVYRIQHTLPFLMLVEEVEMAT